MATPYVFDLMKQFSLCNILNEQMLGEMAGRECN